MRLVFAALALAALAGCGFKPMYAPDAGGGAVIGPVTIAEVPTKTGHVLRTELSRLLAVERNGPARRLDVTVSEFIAPLGLRVDESSSRADLITNAPYTLYDVDGRELVKGSVGAVVSYDLPGSAFGAATAQEDARERAGVLLAQRLRTDIVMRLERARRGAPVVEVLPEPTTPAAPIGVPEVRSGAPGSAPQTSGQQPK